jgi:SM-20-related protein
MVVKDAANSEKNFHSLMRLTGYFQQHVDAIADALASDGYVIIDQALSDDMTEQLRLALRTRRDAMAVAAVGRQGERQVDTTIRGDRIDWLDVSQGGIVTEFLVHMDAFRQAINARLFLGLNEYEAHFACYEPGAFYQKHRDAFRGAPSRKLSSVVYLNQEWESSAGGELVLYDESGEQEIARLTPDNGRMILFLSEDFPHEVLPADRERMSIAGWFRVAG